jgi:hypothetical protein
MSLGSSHSDIFRSIRSICALKPAMRSAIHLSGMGLAGGKGLGCGNCDGFPIWPAKGLASRFRCLDLAARSWRALASSWVSWPLALRGGVGGLAAIGGSWLSWGLVSGWLGIVCGGSRVSSMRQHTPWEYVSATARMLGRARIRVLPTAQRAQLTLGQFAALIFKGLVAARSQEHGDGRTRQHEGLPVS